MRTKRFVRAAILCLIAMGGLSARPCPSPAFAADETGRQDLWLVTATLKETTTTTASGYSKIVVPNTTPSKLFPMREIVIEKKRSLESRRTHFAMITAVMDNEGGEGAVVFSDRKPVSLQVGGSMDHSSTTEELEIINGELSGASDRDIRDSHVQVSEAGVQMQWSDEFKGIDLYAGGKGRTNTRFEKYDNHTSQWKVSTYPGEHHDGFGLAAGDEQEGATYSKKGNTYSFSLLINKTETKPKDSTYDKTTVTVQKILTATVKPYSPPEVRILMVKNGQEEDITDRTVDVVAGEAVSLKTRILPESRKEEGPWTWTISGGGAFGKNYLKKFDANKQYGRVVYPERADLEQKTLRFYWSGGEKGSVKYETKVEGEPASARASFAIRLPNVKVTVDPKPTSHYGQLNKGARLNPGECWVTPAYGSETSYGVQYDGIHFMAELVDPRTPGKFQWVQVITKETVRQRYESGGWADFLVTDALDICYPYQSGPKAMDAPALVVPEDKEREEMIYYTKTQTSRMFLMFKPEAQDSEWIPLRFIDWEWRGAAEYSYTSSQPRWDMDAAVTEEPQGVTPQTADKYPEWEKNAGDDKTYRQVNK